MSLAALADAASIAQHPTGDILVFLTGREEIDRCLQQISDYQHRCVGPWPSLQKLTDVAHSLRLPQGAPLIKAYPLHSGLSTESQIAVFEPAPPRTRKVIVSTNVAEASVTIDGIKFVVDSGLVKVRSLYTFILTTRRH